MTGLGRPLVVRFGLFELDPSTAELRKGGHKVHLQEQPLLVLNMLLDHPGEVVTREDLRARLWPDGTFVDFEHSLNAAIKRLREALDDSADNPRFVETIPRRGYRFIAPVDGSDAWQRPFARLNARKLWCLGVPAGAVVIALLMLFSLNIGGARDRLLGRAGAPQIKSIAVLPLENLSRDSEQEYFVDGMTEALITELAQIRALHVISRTSVMQYKNVKRPLPQIARELNVDAVVEGSVQRAGDKVAISVQLIHAPMDKHLWANCYERDLRDVLALERDVARAIAGEIRVQLTQREQAHLASAHRVSPAAHEAYLKGRYFLSQYMSRQSLEKSQQYFQQAIEIDPSYAMAYAGMADSYTTLAGSVGLQPADTYPKAKEWAQKALRLDDTLADAHASLGVVVLFYEWNWPAAEREFQRAIELNPGSAMGHHFYAHLLSSLGRHDDAIAEIKHAQQLDPLSERINSCVGEVLYEARKYDLAIEDLKSSLELFPNDTRLHENLGWALIGKGSYEQGIAELRNADSLAGSASAGQTARLAIAFARAGRRDEALRILAGLNEQSRRGQVSPIALASLYTALGEKQEAFDWLDDAYAKRYPGLVYLRISFAWDPLRGDERFEDLLRRMNLSQEGHDKE